MYRCTHILFASLMMSMALVSVCLTMYVLLLCMREIMGWNDKTRIDVPEKLLKREIEDRTYGAIPLGLELFCICASRVHIEQYV